uniref:Putative nuclease harbi1-like protein n=1 Tax=Ixodes ricinus TaxID=34613 RepID=A0A6B0UHT1_IXORI
MFVSSGTLYIFLPRRLLRWRSRKQIAEVAVLVQPMYEEPASEDLFETFRMTRARHLPMAHLSVPSLNYCHSFSFASQNLQETSQALPQVLTPLYMRAPTEGMWR